MSDLALGFTLVVIVVVGSRLLFAARRTRQTPELCIGLALILSSVGGTAEVAGLPLAESMSRVQAMVLRGGANFLHVLAAAVLYVAIWRVFHPDRRWARTLAWLGTTLTFGAWLASLSFTPGAAPDVAAARLLFQLGRLGAYAWGGWEALRYYGLMRKRLRLGLADGVVVHQFGFWGIASFCMVTLLAMAVEAEQVMQVWVFDWDAGQLAITVLGLVSSVSLYVAFFPPGFYRRWVDAAASPAALS